MTFFFMPIDDSLMNFSSFVAFTQRAAYIYSLTVTLQIYIRSAVLLYEANERFEARSTYGLREPGLNPFQKS